MLDDLSSANHYDLLELTPDASPQEIRAAYLRAKSAYRKDSVALYTLISEEETEDLLRKIEEAYQILSNPDRRKDYDRNHGLLEVDERSLTKARPPRHSQKIISIDRVPPMEAGSEGDLLVAPSTDFTQSARSTASNDMFGSTEAPMTSSRQAAPAPAAPLTSPASPFDQEPPAPQASLQMGHSTPAMEPASVQIPARAAAPLRATGPDVSPDAAINDEISQEAEWKGTFLRRVRESRQVSIEELSDFTKINKAYLQAIEEENFPKLPAAVFLRGFVSQVAKFLKLPGDKVTQAYMARHQAHLTAAKSEKK